MHQCFRLKGRRVAHTPPFAFGFPSGVAPFRAAKRGENFVPELSSGFQSSPVNSRKTFRNQLIRLGNTDRYSDLGIPKFPLGKT